MGPIYRAPKRSDQGSQLKRTVKYIALCKDPRLQRMILRGASDSVYKSICNAFLNVAENPDINLPLQQRKKLHRYNGYIRKIISPQVKIRRKRQLIQKGDGFFLGALLPFALSTALSFLGSAFFNKQQGQQ